MTASQRPPQGGNLRATFTVPASLACASIAGLVCGLVGDGVLDVLAWLALGTVVAAAAWALIARRSPGARRR